MDVLSTPVPYSHRNLFAFYHASIACPLSFSLFLPLHKPYVTDMEGFMGMGFKDILVWLRSHLAEIVFLLIVLVMLLLMGYWAWAATPRAKDFFPCSSKMGTSVYPPRIEQRAPKTDKWEDKVVQDLPIFHPALRKSVFLS